jgi:hypothetical protein
VFNLGYDEEVAKAYPWVKELSGGIASGHPRRRALGKKKPRPIDGLPPGTVARRPSERRRDNVGYLG